MRRTVFLLAVLGCLSYLAGAVNSIGMAMSAGSFQVDHSRVHGTATLFDGSIVETQAALSQLQLGGGSLLRMGSASRVTVHPHGLVLDFGQVEFTSNYDLQANSLHISAAGPDALARIQMRNQRNVQVAAVRGAVRVTNTGGVLVANVEAGKIMTFEPQENAAVPTRVSGCLLTKAGKTVIAEQTVNVVLELRGPGLDKEIGNRVEVNGTADAANAQIVKVAGIRRIATGGCAAMAKKIGASAAAAGTVAAAGTAAGTAAAAAGTATGIGIGTVAVIGGVAAAATVGSLGLAGALPGQDASNSSVSR
jgi:hypothetical protein